MNLFDMFEYGKKQEIEEACWKGYHKEGMKTMFGKEYPNCKKNKNESLETYVNKGECPGCGGVMVSEEQINEKQDACYHKVKSRYKVWPSAYASGALVQCRKKGAANWGNKNESITQEEYDQLDENLKQWFSDKWVRFGPDGKIRGDCARGDSSEGKPKCLPQSKAQSLGKKGRASAAARKRREDPNPERSGKAINVATKKKSNEGVAEAGDSNFVGFMNKTLADKVDAPKADPMAGAPDFYRNAAVSTLDGRRGFKNALKFGLKALSRLDPETRQQLATGSEQAVEEYLTDVAERSGQIGDNTFVEEDITEVQDYLGDVFHDPSINSWKDVLQQSQGMSEGLAQDEAEEYSGWRAEFVNEINYNTFEVKLTNTRSKESANFIVRPVDMVSYGPALSIETMDVHDLQTGQTESWTNDDPAPEGPIAYAISGLFYDNKQLQQKLQNIIDTHDTKGQDLMPGLDKRRSIGQEVDADAYVDSGKKTQAAMDKMKKGVAEGVPQPGPSSGAPKQFGSDAKIQTRKMTVGQIISSIPGVPYYNNVVDDWDAKDYHSWNVTEKAIEYAEYFKKHPESLAQLKPIIVLNGKFEDGAHRVSAIWLLQQRMDPKNPLWANFKLNVQFVKQDVTEDELEEDWRSALATGAMAGAMAMGAKRLKLFKNLSESRDYYNVMCTDAKSLRQDFNMSKDRHGWFLKEGSTSKQKLDVYRAFGSPKLKEYDLSAFSGGTQTKGDDNVISPVGSQTRAQYKK